MRLIRYSTEEVMGRSLVQNFITDDFKTAVQAAVQAVLDQAIAGDELSWIWFVIRWNNCSTSDGGRAVVKTDLSIACPDGTYARIAPRR